MKEADRKLMRRKLDVEMRPFRRAASDKDATQGLLRAVRLALRIPSREIAAKMGIWPSNVFLNRGTGTEVHDRDAVDDECGGGDGVRGGVWDCATGWFDDGGALRTAAVGQCAGRAGVE